MTLTLCNRKRGKLSLRIRAFALVLAIVASPLNALPAHDVAWRHGELPQTLVLALDGVPYQFINTLYRDGQFQNFFPPSRLVSTFPSMTDVAFSEIFELSAIQGYQQVYFSFEENRVIGGLGSEMFRLEEFEKGFDSIVHNNSHLLTLYVTSYRNAKNEWQQLKKRFWTSRGTAEFVGYIAGSDAIAHRYGAKGLQKYLAYLDAEIADLQHQYRKATGLKLQVVIFSDHGNSMMKGLLIDLRSQLKKSGFNVEGGITNDKSVVSTIAGMVGYLALYAKPESAPALAASLINVEGVDLVMYQHPEAASNNDAGSVMVVNSAGKASVHFDSRRSSGRYQVLTGDPLEYGEILAEADTGPDGYIKQQQLFELTLKHKYPDAIWRIHRCFNGSVRNPATVVVSLKPGYEHSNRMVKAAALLGGRWGTHGSLRAIDSLGVYMRTDRPSTDIAAHTMNNELDLEQFKKRVAVAHVSRDAAGVPQ